MEKSFVYAMKLNEIIKNKGKVSLVLKMIENVTKILKYTEILRGKSTKNELKMFKKVHEAIIFD